jgi:hypothetical protein
MAFTSSSTSPTGVLSWPASTRAVAGCRVPDVGVVVGGQLISAREEAANQREGHMRRAVSER